ncbi:MAG TPA: YraN family protein [Usitatibacter sp.]|nr:YraN family protein [Usitatibacter sp.]
MKASGRRTAAQAAGGAAEEAAARFLVGKGLQLVARNYRTRMGEIDLVAREGETLVFVEVRLRSSARFGSAAASVDRRKRLRLEAAARHFLARLQREPACRFDVVTLEGDSVGEWLRGAFETA